ncbi:uncharacterized protein B0P05DRAFT_530786 [Gilbertella persicaria]|uniref:uncharacterized protein n=1 Tax=Gilbertella persicaria TaxID=101096 RepID=UPI00221EFA5E|nr:uncharacterized protein B0P05DRAFT_530786 [Gilbertella persicaria]KAI8087946.1 hypothetical protein B0P05DRAFT_530786 [Gilbertella persicaria]
MNNPKKNSRTILPLHIDTTSFTNVQTQNNFLKRLNKRQLPIFILSTILFFSLVLNIIQHNHHVMPINTLDPLPPVPLTDDHHAIIVAGHAIYVGPNQLADIRQDENWILEPYQQGGQVNTFIQHIQKGIDILRQDPKSVLIFSGGETRPHAGPRSEAFAYWHIAQLLLDEDEEDQDLRGRMITEEYARDSHENLLFSICRFSEMTGNYPTKITVVGFEFKRHRFENIHRMAIGYPSQQFQYVGIDPPEQDPSREKGELVNSVQPFEKDLYGCHGSLRQKKMYRNPYRRRHAYATSCPILAPLLNYCPSNNAVYSGLLPWNS